MLKNAYLLAKIGADTAENERHFAEKLPKIGNYATDPIHPHNHAQAPPGTRWRGGSFFVLFKLPSAVLDLSVHPLSNLGDAVEASRLL